MPSSTPAQLEVTAESTGVPLVPDGKKNIAAAEEPEEPAAETRQVAEGTAVSPAVLEQIEGSDASQANPMNLVAADSSPEVAGVDGTEALLAKRSGNETPAESDRLEAASDSAAATDTPKAATLPEQEGAHSAVLEKAAPCADAAAEPASQRACETALTQPAAAVEAPEAKEAAQGSSAPEETAARVHAAPDASDFSETVEVPQEARPATFAAGFAAGAPAASVPHRGADGADSENNVPHKEEAEPRLPSEQEEAEPRLPSEEGRARQPPAPTSHHLHGAGNPQETRVSTPPRQPVVAQLPATSSAYTPSKRHHLAAAHEATAPPAQPAKWPALLPIAASKSSAAPDCAAEEVDVGSDPPSCTEPTLVYNSAGKLTEPSEACQPMPSEGPSPGASPEVPPLDLAWVAATTPQDFSRKPLEAADSSASSAAAGSVKGVRPGPRHYGTKMWHAQRQAWKKGGVEGWTHLWERWEQSQLGDEDLVVEAEQQSGGSSSSRSPAAASKAMPAGGPLTDQESRMLRRSLQACRLPYPRLRRPLPLRDAVRMAVDIWREEEDDWVGASWTSVTHFASEARRRSVELIGLTQEAGKSLTRLGESLFGGQILCSCMPESERYVVDGHEQSTIRIHEGDLTQGDAASQQLDPTRGDAAGQQLDLTQGGIVSYTEV
eukprot:TRINITY_DN8845_c0_g1_i1.p1 TRINITY_DN8845_c0_g1~~TRINITY_DN8845_c0_g1_i1.p1  ORF type:complete len:665 (+),score=153.39 TRINITY_DN8845_c0_g1_i1:88-2082(+)